MTRLCEGRVAIVTGAGRGIGREHSLELARQGAKVVVNDLGGANGNAAQGVVDEIVGLGGQAVVNGSDITDWKGAEQMIAQAVDTFGSLDVLVNNAGISRDRTIVSMTEEEWDSVIRVHTRGTFAPMRAAGAYWRAKSKQSGNPVDGRLINTSSGAGLFGNFGQSNYALAKAGIAAMTLIAAKEFAGYGVTANAIAPIAFTQMTAGVYNAESGAAIGPEHVAALVTWLASGKSAGITGRVFHVRGSRIGIVDGWALAEEIEKDGLWTVEELGERIPGLVARARPSANELGRIPE